MKSNSYSHRNKRLSSQLVNYYPNQHRKRGLGKLGFIYLEGEEREEGETKRKIVLSH